MGGFHYILASQSFPDKNISDSLHLHPFIPAATVAVGDVAVRTLTAFSTLPQMLLQQAKVQH